MIDNSDITIFYADKKENSGAYKAYKYAKNSPGKRVVNLWEDWFNITTQYTLARPIKSKGRENENKKENLPWGADFQP